jgi:hypothetical protein
MISIIIIIILYHYNIVDIGGLVDPRFEGSIPTDVDGF